MKFSGLKTKLLLISSGFLLAVMLIVVLGFSLFILRSLKNQAQNQVISSARYYASSLQSEFFSVQQQMIELEKRIELLQDHERQFALQQFVQTFSKMYLQLQIADSSGATVIFEATSHGDVAMTVASHGAELVQTGNQIEVRGPMIGDYGYVWQFVSPFAGGEKQLTTIVSCDEFFYRLRQGAAAITKDQEVFVVDTTGRIIDANDAAQLNLFWRDLHEKPNQTPGVNPQFVFTQMNTDFSSLSIIVRRDISPMMNRWKRLLIKLNLLALVMFIVVLGASWILIGRFTGSIAGVARAAEKIAAGDFSQKLGPVRDDELGVLYQSFNDMTQKLEQSYSDLELKIAELKAARKKLLHSERMALMGEAVSKVSHEIQNKISGVSIWVQNLEMYLRADDTAQAYIQELEIALDSFYQMMMRFKQFYREPVLHKSDVDICALLKQNMIWVEKEYQDKKLRVNITCHEPVSVRIDSELMSAAILNIVRNAIEFSPVDGVIDIDIENNDDKILMTISDQGPGIDAGDIDEIFQPFYTTKSSGSGLGLPIAQNIVAAHGGKISAQNRTHGTQFTIQFPQKGTDHEHPDR